MTRQVLTTSIEFGHPTPEESFDEYRPAHSLEVLRKALEWVDNGGELPRLGGV